MMSSLQRLRSWSRRQSLPPASCLVMSRCNRIQKHQRATLVSGNFSARQGEAGVLTLAGALFFLVAAFTLLEFASGGRDRENFSARENVGTRRVRAKPARDPGMLASSWAGVQGEVAQGWRQGTGRFEGDRDFAVAVAISGAAGLRGGGLWRRPLT